MSASFFPITPPAAPGATWYETGTEEYAVTAGEKAPSTCCCEAAK